MRQTTQDHLGFVEDSPEHQSVPGDSGEKAMRVQCLRLLARLVGSWQN